MGLPCCVSADLIIILLVPRALSDFRLPPRVRYLMLCLATECHVGLQILCLRTQKLKDFQFKKYFPFQQTHYCLTSVTPKHDVTTRTWFTHALMSSNNQRREAMVEEKTTIKRVPVVCAVVFSLCFTYLVDSLY